MTSASLTAFQIATSISFYSPSFSCGSAGTENSSCTVSLRDVLMYSSAPAKTTKSDPLSYKTTPLFLSRWTKPCEIWKCGKQKSVEQRLREAKCSTVMACGVVCCAAPSEPIYHVHQGPWMRMVFHSHLEQLANLWAISCAQERYRRLLHPLPGLLCIHHLQNPLRLR